MNKTELWSRFSNFYRYYDSVGIALDVSRVRFTEGFFDKLSPQIGKSLSAMKSLESGAIANPDEKRMVGHYWLRAPELAPNAEITDSIESMRSDVQHFVNEIHQGRIAGEHGRAFKNVLIVGIGGSALGPQLVADALGTSEDKLAPYFIDNTDPDGIARTLSNLKGSLDVTLTLVISKSGGTVETRNGMLETRRAYKEAGLDFAKHAVAVTGAGSKLDSIASSDGWISRFEMWDWVGGRTSLFSAVGLLPAALQGIDIEAFTVGAKEMDELTRTESYSDNPSMLLSLMWYAASNGKGEKDMVILPYKDRLVLLSKYLQQLVMESLGKEKDLQGNIVHQGLAVYGNKGSTDQHAYIQQLRDGVNNFFATFLVVLKDQVTPHQGPALEVEEQVTSGDYLNGFFQGTRRALYENGRDSISIFIDSLDAKSLGSLIALYERAVGFYATMVNINAYHQPGVEAGKKAAEKVVELQQALLKVLPDKSSPLTAKELAAKIGEKEEAESVFLILEHLSANSHAKVRRVGPRSPSESQFCRAESA